jgi:hypothetical protein
MPRPNLSALFSRFVFREILSNQDKIDIRADINAEEQGAAALAQSAAISASQPRDSDLTAIAALVTTAFGRSALVDANAAAGRTRLGLDMVARTAADGSPNGGYAVSYLAVSGGTGTITIGDRTYQTSASTINPGDFYVADSDPETAANLLVGLINGVDDVDVELYDPPAHPTVVASGPVFTSGFWEITLTALIPGPEGGNIITEATGDFDVPAPIMGSPPDVLSGTFIGQLCRVGTINPVWYVWNGTQWDLVGPSGVFADTDDPTLYYRTTTASGVLQTELYTPADS